MTLIEYIRELNNITKEFPESKDFTVIYASDDEGNSFHELCVYPSLAKFDEIGPNDLFNVHFEIDRNEANAVCIN